MPENDEDESEDNNSEQIVVNHYIDEDDRIGNSEEDGYQNQHMNRESFRPVSILDKGLDINEDEFNYDHKGGQGDNYDGYIDTRMSG